MLSALSSIWNEVERAALDAGALAAGASDIEDQHATVFERWIDQSHQASMGYLTRNLSARLDPRSRFPWARSVVAITVPYSSERPTGTGSIASGIARYALGDDYHDVVDSILRRVERVVVDRVPDATTRRYVDTGPLSDRAFAQQAGLGWIGRNAMLIDPVHGSWFLIGILLTSLENDLQPEEITDRCGQCTLCVEACPTDAILPGRTVDSSLCISHATIEQRGPMSEPARSHLEGNLFGCDICQEVCPWNASPPPSHPSFTPRAVYASTPVHALLRMSQTDFSSMFRKSAVKRAKRVGMIRNAILMSKGFDPDDLDHVIGEGDPGIVDAMANEKVRPQKKES